MWYLYIIMFDSLSLRLLQQPHWLESGLRCTAYHGWDCRVSVGGGVRKGGSAMWEGVTLGLERGGSAMWEG